MITKSIYELELHEFVDLTKNICVLRVPGGFLYLTVIANGSGTSAFVPFNNEFQQNKKSVKKSMHIEKLSLDMSQYDDLPTDYMVKDVMSKCAEKINEYVDAINGNDEFQEKKEEKDEII